MVLDSRPLFPKVIIEYMISFDSYFCFIKKKNIANGRSACVLELKCYYYHLLCVRVHYDDDTNTFRKANELLPPEIKRQSKRKRERKSRSPKIMTIQRKRICTLFKLSMTIFHNSRSFTKKKKNQVSNIFHTPILIYIKVRKVCGDG